MVRPILLLIALAASGLAWGQTPVAPSRIARLSYVEGAVNFQDSDAPASSALPDRPLEPGDRLVTGNGGRAEIQLGAATIRLDEQSDLTVTDLDEATVRVELYEGSASVTLRDLSEDETFEVLTPNAAITLVEPGEYRVDADADDLSALTVHNGAAEVESASGLVRIAGGQRVRLEGRDAIARLESPRGKDAFDDWVLEREVRVAEAEPPRYTPFEDGDYEELDGYGEWYDEPGYGRVWMPSYGYGGWSPYYSGYWRRSGYGWSWYDPVPWSYFTFYYGNWTYLDHRNRWCWVPTRHHDRRDYGYNTRWVPVTPGGARPRSDRRETASALRAQRESIERRRVATTAELPRRIDYTNRGPAPRRDAEPDRQPRGVAVRQNASRGQDTPRRVTPVRQSEPPARRESKPERSRGNERSTEKSARNPVFGTRQVP